MVLKIKKICQCFLLGKLLKTTKSYSLNRIFRRKKNELNGTNLQIDGLLNSTDAWQGSCLKPQVIAPGCDN